MNATPLHDSKPTPKSSFTIYGRGSDAKSQAEHTKRLFDQFWSIHEGFVSAKLNGKVVKPKTIKGEQTEIVG